MSEINRFGEMSVFVRVVDLGGFSVAARACRMTPSAVSKLVSRLEARLGARLINRTTRRLQLTPEGTDFFERSVRLLADLEEAERSMSATGTPSGPLRVSVNVPFGTQFLLPIVPDFLACHPGITLEIVLTDAVIDLVEARTDLAIRAGPLKSSGLIARKLGETGKVVVAAPAYLEQHGIPETPTDLAGHNLIRFGYSRATDGWPFRIDGQPWMMTPTGNTRISDGEAMRQLAVAGVGVARLASFQAEADIAAGRLVALLEAFNPGDREEIHAVFVGHGNHLPARVRALLEFLHDRVVLP
jgi:DNA-binding transcriptional LysR family regulator